MGLTIKGQRIVVFSLTFLSYALYHASRKNLSGVKASIANDWLNNGTSDSPHMPFFNSEIGAHTFLGILDALFMIFYAGALVYWGWLGDRFNPLKVVVFGMYGSAVTLFLFGYIPHVLGFFSIFYYLIVYAAFGIAQACGWPNEVSIMAKWFDKSNRGLIMGLWAACQPVGNILGAIFVFLVLPFGYQYTFLFNSFLIIIGAIILFLFVQPKPNESVGAQSFNRQLSTNSFSSTELNEIETSENVSNPQITILEALNLPTVLPYCLCNICLKFVNYAFFFWLPFYLTHKYLWLESNSNLLSIMYDLGGIFGSVIGGFVSDRLGLRSPVLMVMLFTSLPLLLIYAQLSANELWHGVFMVLLGATISGPYNLIVGTISVDLGSQPALAGNADAMSTVTGLIDGTGSAGSAIGQLFIPIIQNLLGWNYVFYLFILMNIFSIFCLLKMFFRDCCVIWKSRQSNEGIVGNWDENSPLLS